MLFACLGVAFANPKNPPSLRTTAGGSFGVVFYGVSSVGVMVGAYQPERKGPFFCLVICIHLGVGNKRWEPNG